MRAAPAEARAPLWFRPPIFTDAAPYARPVSRCPRRRRRLSSSPGRRQRRRYSFSADAAAGLDPGALGLFCQHRRSAGHLRAHAQDADDGRRDKGRAARRQQQQQGDSRDEDHREAGPQEGLRRPGSAERPRDRHVGLRLQGELRAEPAKAPRAPHLVLHEGLVPRAVRGHPGDDVHPQQLRRDDRQQVAPRSVHGGPLLGHDAEAQAPAGASSFRR